MNVCEMLDQQPLNYAGDLKKVGENIHSIIDYEKQKGLRKGSLDTGWLMFRAYTLGFIEGKRAERKRKKR